MIVQRPYPVEPWCVSETALDLGLLAQSESLFALTRVPVDVLKLDRDFVLALSDEGHTDVVAGVVAFATRLGVKLPLRQFCSTCVLQICSMDVLQRNNKQNQTTVRSKV